MAAQAIDELDTTLYTERLVLRLADPYNDGDCELILRAITDPHIGKGGNGRIGVNTIEDVRYKFEMLGPRDEYCTRVRKAPNGHIHIIYLQAENKKAGDMIGFISINWRSGVPYPDLGWGVYEQFQGHGYASEAGRGALRFWREDVGVREIWAGTLSHNVRSQRCARRVGFVDPQPNGLDIVFGKPGSGDAQRFDGTAFVLPGMKWKEFQEDGSRTVIYPTIGKEPEALKNAEIDVA